MEDNQIPGTPDFDEDDGIEPQEKSTVSLIKAKIYKPTIEAFVELIAEHYGDKLRLNEMTNRMEWWSDRTNRWNMWSDADENKMAMWFESNFGLYSTRKLQSAISIYFNQQRVNPLTDILEGLTWDGKPRVERMLIDTVLAEDTPFNREASRLIFAGGIHRAYDPGCKFDEMIVLIGDQGCGKSTLVRMLNMQDVFYRQIKTITGKEGVEALRGVWIGEMDELMAMTRVKETEAVKAFITAQEDTYRPAYARHEVTLPRRCIFIGTTNTRQFLTDKTGNRRFYPVYCTSTENRLLADEDKWAEYLAQCWAEAMVLYKEGKLTPHIDPDLIKAAREMQDAAVEDDWRVGAIEQYLADTKQAPDAYVTAVELWHNALRIPEEKKPERSDSIAIVKIMDSMEGWTRGKNKKDTNWGRQRYWIKRRSFFPF